MLGVGYPASGCLTASTSIESWQVILMLAIALVLSQMAVGANALLYCYAVLAGLGFSGAFTCIQILIAAHYSGPLYWRILATIVLIDTLWRLVHRRSPGSGSGRVTTLTPSSAWRYSLR